MVRFERDRAEEQMNILRVELQQQMETMKAASYEQAHRVLEYVTRKVQEAPRILTVPQEEYRPAPTRSEIYAGLVEGPGNAQTENVTIIRSKPVSRTFFEEADQFVFESTERINKGADIVFIALDKEVNHKDYEHNIGDARKPPDRDKNYLLGKLIYECSTLTVQVM